MHYIPKNKTAVSVSAGIPALAVFDTESEPSSLKPPWQAWRERLKIYVTVAGVKDDVQKRVLLLDALNKHFEPKKNIRYERYVLKQETE